MRHELLGRVHARRGTRLVEIEDDRVMPGASRTVTLRLPRGGGDDRAIRYEIRLWSLDPELARSEHLPDQDVVRRVMRGIVR